MVTCPHCGAARCIGVLRKLALGPTGRTTCGTCGLRVKADTGQSLIALAPPVLLLALLTTGLVRDPLAMAVLMAASLGTAVVLSLGWVRLVPAQLSNASTVAAAKTAKRLSSSPFVQGEAERE